MNDGNHIAKLSVKYGVEICASPNSHKAVAEKKLLVSSSAQFKRESFWYRGDFR
jgi:hypothetical protein